MATPPSRYHASSANQSPPDLVSADPASSVRFPGEDGGRSLAEMARRDLDAALQLLVDRAQYITGASGAAIALRRNGKNDMLCRASSGSNAPELGALLSTEYGLSGESVRTRQPLRCDDAERDVRVNREVCRQLGIASVVVMPVVNDDGVLGVFELFSGNVNAFGERDLSAVQRLSELVETAVRLAEAAEKLPERLQASQTSAPAPANEIEEDKVLEALVLDELGLGVVISEPPDPEKLVTDVVKDDEPVLDELVLGDIVPKESKPAPELKAKTEEKVEAPQTEVITEKTEREAPSLSKATLETKTAEATTKEPREEAKTAETKTAERKTAERKTEDAKTWAFSEAPRKDAAPMVVETAAAAVPDAPKTSVPEKAVASAQSSPAPSANSVEIPAPKKPLFWTAEIHPGADAAKAEKADRSHVPPVLRNLRKCEACGFPVSADRALCVECEEKKWRGQLKPASALRKPTNSVVPNATIPTAKEPQAPPPNPETRTLVAEIQTVAAPVPAFSTQLTSTAVTESRDSADQPLPTLTTANTPAEQTKSAAEPVETSSSNFVLSAGLEPSESWLSANKYVLGVLIVACILVAVFLLLR